MTIQPLNGSQSDVFQMPLIAQKELICVHPLYDTFLHWTISVCCTLLQQALLSEAQMVQ